MATGGDSLDSAHARNRLRTDTSEEAGMEGCFTCVPVGAGRRRWSPPGPTRCASCGAARDAHLSDKDASAEAVNAVAFASTNHTPWFWACVGDKPARISSNFEN